MKKLLIIGVLAVVGLSGCQTTDQYDSEEIDTSVIDPENPPVLEFDEPEFDFGKMSMGSTVKFTFKFKNSGKSPLLIQSVKAQCGCTVPEEWPRHKINPGESGEIPVSFTPKTVGKVKKFVSIIANTSPATSKVYIVGEVVGPK